MQVRFKGKWVECLVLHQELKIVRIEQVKTTRYDYASFSLYLHAFIRKMKDKLKNVPDLRGAKVACLHNGKIVDFILEVMRALSFAPGRRIVFVAVYNETNLLFAGTIDL